MLAEVRRGCQGPWSGSYKRSWAVWGGCCVRAVCTLTVLLPPALWPLSVGTWAVIASLRTAFLVPHRFLHIVLSLWFDSGNFFPPFFGDPFIIHSHKFLAVLWFCCWFLSHTVRWIQEMLSTVLAFHTCFVFYCLISSRESPSVCWECLSCDGRRKCSVDTLRDTWKWPSLLARLRFWSLPLLLY